MRNAITACAVMAFSFAGANAYAEPEEDAGGRYVSACEDHELGPKFASPGENGRLLAAFAEMIHDIRWVNLLQRDGKFLVESGINQTRRQRVDPELAQRISSQLMEDISRRSFRGESDEIHFDAPWYFYSADGQSCAATDIFDMNRRGYQWKTIFETLASDSAQREPTAWFWLDRLEQSPNTLPTSLAGMTRENAVIGAASAWMHPGTEPLTILNHRASPRYSDDGVNIIGELVNNTHSARNDLKVTATLFDSNGAVLGTQEDDVEFQPLPAGARTPFLVQTDRKDFASYTLHIEPGYPVRVRPPTVRITHRKAQQDDEDLIVRGTVRNDGRRDEDSIEVVLSVYDEAGRLLDADSDVVAVPLKAGASAPFEVSVQRPPGYHHYEVIVNPVYRESRE